MKAEKNMNMKEIRLLELLQDEEMKAQQLADELQLSTLEITHILQILKQGNLINEENKVSELGYDYLLKSKPQRAIILAAGMGFRMIPLNKVTNKALLCIHGTTLIEHLIGQLHEAGIQDIDIVIGYQKERFEYLIDQYHVNLIVNNDYFNSNSLHSLYLAKNKLQNCYIVPCDLYFYDNPFLKQRSYSWYMLPDSFENNQSLQKFDCLCSFIDQGTGLAYISKDQSVDFINCLTSLHKDPSNKNAYWENCLSKMTMFFPVFINDKNYVECNCCEDLISIDENSPDLDTQVFNIIMQVFNIQRSEIKNITCQKAGMTNNSFLFEIHSQKYIMRIPGEGTDKLINRKEEYDVYQKIKNYNLSDKVYYIDPKTGYKITAFIENAHNCDPLNLEEVKAAMHYLKNFHEMKLSVNHYFDIFAKIDYYESLWQGKLSIYKDYQEVKEHVFRLKTFIESKQKNYVLTHIDAVCDNFIFHQEEKEKKINLIDWEYASMQDPHVDIAMFAIYALYDEEQVDTLIDFYFDCQCSEDTRYKIYAYIASCGLLWSNWCEYKLQLGIEFGEYSLRQYHYAKVYYKKVIDRIGEESCEL